MSLSTRLTEKYNLKWPILSAPMAGASGGELAAQVTLGGGLGLIGSGYGDHDFNEQAWRDAGNSEVAIGFITWSLEKQPHLLDEAIAHKPKAIMLSFGDPLPFAKKISDAGIPLICQCQTIRHVEEALDAGAEIIVAQGTEAGGHGAKRATMTLVPECADYIQSRNSRALLLAAGGIGDGRGIAASLMLGADGVLIGSRYWATSEALVHTNFQNAAINASGDDTIRTDVPDIARNLVWPPGFDIRVLANNMMSEYDGQRANLDKRTCEQIGERYLDAAKNGNIDDGGIIVGEVAGLINDLPSAAQLTTRMGEEAAKLLGKA